jgi:hypothetical protein
LIRQYIYIDRLLDSSLPHDLLNEYVQTTASGSSSNRDGVGVPPTISEEPQPSRSSPGDGSMLGNGDTLPKKLKRTPRELYRVPSENTPLLLDGDDETDYEGPKPEIPGVEDDSVESGDRIVQIAIYINLVANAVLLAGKIVVILLTNSLSVLASLVDATLDFLSTAIVWTTTQLIERQDQYQYPGTPHHVWHDLCKGAVLAVVPPDQEFECSSACTRCRDRCCFQCFQHYLSPE